MAVKMGHLPASSLPLQPLALRRGVVLDGLTGNVCIMNPLQRVSRFSHGFGALQDARAVYGETEIEVDGHRPGGSRWWVMGTHFELPFQQLFQLGVSHIDQHEQDEDKRSQCYSVMLKSFKDIVNRLFGDPESAFFAGIQADPQRYIISSSDLVPHIKHLRQSGTKVVVVSNSMPFFVRIVLKAAFADSCDSLFDLVVARSLKPSFFAQAPAPALPFLHPESQAQLHLSSCGLSLVSGGNDIELLEFMNSKDLSSGSRPSLFVGDSVTHDVISPSCTGRWQAAAIVEELLGLEAQPRCHPLVATPIGFPSM
jgi:FMN phosphatase YigB (HAD superfamily)